MLLTKKTKLISFLLISVICFSLLASCGSTGNDADTSGVTDGASDDRLSESQKAEELLRQIEIDSYGERDGLFSYTVSEEGSSINYYWGLEETEIIIPDTIGDAAVCAIGDGVFQGHNEIERAVLPDSVRTVGVNAFADCGKLESLVYGDDISEVGYNAFSGTPWLEDIEDEFVIIGDGVLLRYNGTDEDVTVPAEVKYISNLFRNNDTEIKTVTLSEGNIIVGSHAFSGSKSLEKVVFSDTVERIDEGAFQLCSALTDVEINSGVSKIGSFAFSHCKSLEKIDLSCSAETIPESLFFGCGKLTDVTLPEGLLTIGLDAFNGCISLTELSVPATVTEISAAAFDEGAEMTLKSAAGSAAEEFCSESEGFTFVAID